MRATFRPTECRIERASYLPRAVLRGDDIRTRSRSPFRCPLGIVVLFRQSGPALSSGPVSSVEVAAGPSAGRVLGNAPGPTTADRFRERAAATRQQGDDAGLLSVGFSTHSTRMLAACPPRNTKPIWPMRGPGNALRWPALDPSVGLANEPHAAPALPPGNCFQEGRGLRT